MAKVGAIILAAGESSRFGQPKQLIQFGGLTLIGGIIMAAKEAECDPIIVVTGSDSAKIAAALRDKKSVSIIENTHWREGIGSSIRAGMQELINVAPDAKGVVLLVCDQPFVTGKIVSGLIERWSATGKPIAASSYANTLGVPALFDSSCFNDLLRVESDRGAKSLILANPDRVTKMPFPGGASDIDSTLDYEALIGKNSEGTER
jgi:molybdenum cofactor cytidylyltransferase